MNSKKCARCDKTVYPIEELKCLDKTWHKLCFKCQECGMTLNMKTYKGYNKLPYCNAHTPQATHTSVADTPESKRLAENTKLQSQVKYHEDFEKAKGKLTQVADDPETMRLKQQSKIISNVAYHGDLERKQQMENRRQYLDGDGNETIVPAPQMFDYQGNQQRDMPRFNPKQVIYSSQDGGALPVQRMNTGSIADYDPMMNTNIMPQPQYQYNARTTTSATSNLHQHHPQQQQQQHHPQMQQQQQQYKQQQPAMMQMPQQSIQPQMPAQHYRPPPQQTGRAFRAMYDYAAQDRDEVSFNDGDTIIGCVPIDEGWMTGTVQRTGQRGMLPANYVLPL